MIICWFQISVSKPDWETQKILLSILTPFITTSSVSLSQVEYGLMEILNNVLFFLIAIAVLVSFHEFGHFIVARWLGVRVLKFSVGFGKTIWRWQRAPTETEYAVGAIPLGGYVRMLDEREGDVAAEERDHAFNRKPLSSRSLIVLAGPAANLLLAVVLYWLIGMMGTDDLEPVVGQAAERMNARPGAIN